MIRSLGSVVILSFLVAGCYPMGLSKEEWNTLPLEKRVELREKQARINTQLAEKQAIADAARYRLEAARAEKELNVAVVSATSATTTQSSQINASPNIVINNTNQQSQSQAANTKSTVTQNDIRQQEEIRKKAEAERKRREAYVKFHHLIMRGHHARTQGRYAAAEKFYHQAVLIAPDKNTREKARILERSSRHLKNAPTQHKKG